MLLIVGLGNPGIGYINTRHNIGYDIARQIATHYGSPPLYKDKFKSDIALCNIEGNKLLISCPQK